MELLGEIQTKCKGRTRHLWRHVPVLKDMEGFEIYRCSRCGLKAEVPVGRHEERADTEVR